MKTILFKGKRIDNNEWVYGYYVSDPEDGHLIIGYSSEITEPETNFSEPVRHEFQVIKETISQFTNSVDCSGKEVYENDILFNEDRIQHQVVFYDEERFCYFCKYAGCEEIVSLCNSLGNTNYKVGNIFDNAELLSF